MEIMVFRDQQTGEGRGFESQGPASGHKFTVHKGPPLPHVKRQPVLRASPCAGPHQGHPPLPQDRLSTRTSRASHLHFLPGPSTGLAPVWDRTEGPQGPQADSLPRNCSTHAVVLSQRILDVIFNIICGRKFGFGVCLLISSYLDFLEILTPLLLEGSSHSLSPPPSSTKPCSLDFNTRPHAYSAAPVYLEDPCLFIS